MGAKILEKYNRGFSKDVYKIVKGDETKVEPNPMKVVHGKSTSKHHTTVCLPEVFGQNSKNEQEQTKHWAP